jgi:hypothetical protein
MSEPLQEVAIRRVASAVEGALWPRPLISLCAQFSAVYASALGSCYVCVLVANVLLRSKWPLMALLLANALLPKLTAALRRRQAAASKRVRAQDPTRRRWTICGDGV